MSTLGSSQWYPYSTPEAIPYDPLGFEGHICTSWLSQERELDSKFDVAEWHHLSRTQAISGYVLGTTLMIWGTTTHFEKT